MEFKTETPTLVFDGISTATNDLPAKADNEMKEEIILSEEEKAQVEAFAKQIDLSNSTAILNYGAGTQKKLSKITEELSFIQQFCDDFKSKTGIRSLEIEYGPGLSYDYFSLKEEESNYSEAESLSKLLKDSSYTFVIELGRYIASACGKYITKIVDVKGDEKNHYCLIDGGINHINYYGQMMGMKNPKVNHIAKNQNKQETKNYTIAGSLCTTADIVLRQLPLSSPEIGDLLVFNDIGAYSITEGIYLFLSHPLPVVLVNDNDKISMLRKAVETYIINA